MEIPNRRDITAAAVPNDTKDFESAALIDRHELQILRSGIIRGRTDKFVVDALFHHVRGPSRRARDDEQRGEHRHRHTQHVVADG